MNLEKWKIGVLALAFCLCLGVHMKTEAASKVKGIDVSVNNGIVDWESVKNQGLHLRHDKDRGWTGA